MTDKGKITVSAIRAKKKEGKKIVALTAYDYFTARVLNEAGVDIILVGDSLGMVVLGYENTLLVTMEEMIHHMKAVSRGNSRCLLVGDMPFLSYQISEEEALRNAGRFVQEAGAQAVKLEGGKSMAPLVSRMVGAGIPVLGHIGLTPQDILNLGGYKVQGRNHESASALLADARALEAAGAFAVVLECVPAALAGEITAALSVPTIGIGAGPLCDGQILVTSDLLGMFDRFKPKFVKRYADLWGTTVAALGEYKKEVEEGTFPSGEQSY
ncbi:MAG: 3-methyl-2-oxobutanoate hydroxymethyltransferase [Candidatus Aureabacteria bacterium]|nr:3-methyl-2-oxobutanoate hydroxymethyltransferase [Candidatus Auribacterota bacterium]